MISHKDKQFINHWVEQKSGPKWKYYFLFSLAWSAVAFIVLFFLTKLFTMLWETGGQNLIYILIAISVIAGFVFTHLSYMLNEKKYHQILAKDKVELN